MRAIRLKPILVTLLFLMPCIRPVFAQSGHCLVEAARKQIGITTLYDSKYVVLNYPGGDVAPDRGVCTDVIVRAYRQFGIDLQRLVHEDRRRKGSVYSKLWKLARPDPNIDHRRVPNLATFFSRHGQTLATSRQPAAYLPGDLVTWRLPAGVPHIGIVSNRRAAAGTPLVIHNIGLGAVEENVLFSFTITGHYRYLPPPVADACKASGA